MKHIYFDQNITDKICRNVNFSSTFCQKHVNHSRQLAITPLCLIEFCGSSVNKCLQPSVSEYNADFSGNIFREIREAREYYQNHVRPDILEYLSNFLEYKGRHIKTYEGMQIYEHYKTYLDDPQRKEEIISNIVNDRAFALPLERFKTRNTYSHIFSVASQFLALSPYIPCLRLCLKSIKKLPVSKNPITEEERKKLICIIEKADVKQNCDLIDTELIQFAIMGGSNRPLHIYTMDSVRKIKARLYATYFLLKVMVQEAKDELRTLGLRYENVDTMNVDNIQNARLFDINDNDENKRLKLKLLQRVACHEFRFGKISVINTLGCVKENINIKTFFSTFKGLY